ncbi:hypothetical protein B296_00039295 [Ensete ventricosum]|uniref:Secreted protein n=1 Tax=Ensete ventricosum TaxID=4639 RepID=A0A426YY46_ENSVE|nr:hypothetical protein B296_00039295 [Ensete ventricosum]
MSPLPPAAGRCLLFLPCRCILRLFPLSAVAPSRCYHCCHATTSLSLSTILVVPCHSNCCSSPSATFVTAKRSPVTAVAPAPTVD